MVRTDRHNDKRNLLFVKPTRGKVVPYLKGTFRGIEKGTYREEQPGKTGMRVVMLLLSHCNGLEERMDGLILETFLSH